MTLLPERLGSILAVLALLLPACSPASGNDAGVDAASDARSDTANTMPVTVRFRAVVGSRPFSCTQTYAGLGTTMTTWTPMDLRFFVHNVRLLTASGAETPVQLDDDGLWQHGPVALLDFEDKTGSCSAGTTPTNDRVTGRVAPGSYVGLRFNVGVPFELDHQDVSTASSPLDVSGMFWSWASGYRFVRIEGATTGLRGGFNIHIGSTGCTADATGRVNTPCSAPNVSEVTLMSFDAASNTVVADLATLTADSNLDVNTMGTAPGCMSEPTDPECAPLFARLGLGAAPAGQQFFRVQ